MLKYLLLGGILMQAQQLLKLMGLYEKNKKYFSKNDFKKLIRGFEEKEISYTSIKELFEEAANLSKEDNKFRCYILCQYHWSFSIVNIGNINENNKRLLKDIANKEKLEILFKSNYSFFYKLLNGNNKFVNYFFSKFFSTKTLEAADGYLSILEVFQKKMIPNMNTIDIAYAINDIETETEVYISDKIFVCKLFLNSHLWYDRLVAEQWFLSMLTNYGYEYTKVILRIENEIGMVFYEGFLQPQEVKIRTEIYKKLLDFDNLLFEFVNAYNLAKQVLFDESLPVEVRYDYIELFANSLVMKDKSVAKLIETYNKYGKRHALLLSYILRNNGVRTNILCASFLDKITDEVVLDMARIAFRENNIRKNAEGLCLLNDAKTVEEQKAILNYLIDENKRKMKLGNQLEVSLDEKVDELGFMYQEYLEGKLSFGALKEKLEQVQDLNLKLVPKKRK